MAQPVASGYTVDDLTWLRSVVGIGGHLELDPWGNLIVTPASDEHEVAISILHGQAVEHLGRPARLLTGIPWKVRGGSGYTNVPDLTVLPPDWRRTDDDQFDPPPLLVVEVASPSTVRIDRTRKRRDYRRGGTGLYVRVDFYAPGRAGFEVFDLRTGSIRLATTAVDLVVDGQPLRFDLGGLPRG